MPDGSQTAATVSALQTTDPAGRGYVGLLELRDGVLWVSETCGYPMSAVDWIEAEAGRLHRDIEAISSAADDLRSHGGKSRLVTNDVTNYDVTNYDPPATDPPTGPRLNRKARRRKQSNG
jgi:hypothetical protein